MGKTMIVNYGVTMDGLANQLLNVVVAHERADLEESYAALVTQMSESASLLVSFPSVFANIIGRLQGLTGCAPLVDTLLLLRSRLIVSCSKYASQSCCLCVLVSALTLLSLLLL
jgi:ATP-binding dynein motor region